MSAYSWLWYVVIGIMLGAALFMCFWALNDGTNTYKSVDLFQYLLDFPSNFWDGLSSGVFIGRIPYIVHQVADRDWSSVSDVVQVIPDALRAYTEYGARRIEYLRDLVGLSYVYEFEVNDAPYTEDDPLIPPLEPILPPAGEGGASGDENGDDEGGSGGNLFPLPPSVILPPVLF